MEKNELREMLDAFLTEDDYFPELLHSQDLRNERPKAIMYKGVICSRDCAITFYKPYKELRKHRDRYMFRRKRN